MIFPYIIITSLAVLMSGQVAIVDSNSIVSNSYTSNPSMVDFSRTYHRYANGYHDIDSDYTLYFYANPNNYSESLASLRVQTIYNDDNTTDYTFIFNARSLANCSWIGSINGIGVEDYEFTNYIGYTISYDDGIASFTQICNMGTSYQNFTVENTYSFTNDNVFYRSHTQFSIYLLNAHDVSIYTSGYTNGLNENENWSLSNYLFSIVDLPVLYLKSLFGFDLFGGISIFAVITSLISIALIAFIIRKFI